MFVGGRVGLADIARNRIVQLREDGEKLVRNLLAFPHRKSAGLRVGFIGILPGEIGNTVLQGRPFTVEIAEFAHAVADIRIRRCSKTRLQCLDLIAALGDFVDIAGDLRRIRVDDRVLFGTDRAHHRIGEITGVTQVGDRASNHDRDVVIERREIVDRKTGHCAGQENDETEHQAQFEFDREAHSKTPSGLLRISREMTHCAAVKTLHALPAGPVCPDASMRRP